MLTARETIKPSWPSIHLSYCSSQGKEVLRAYALCVATVCDTHGPQSYVPTCFTPTELLH